jgi:UDP:flavonoid glycosyltransferase YjiC (YdhE family)
VLFLSRPYAGHVNPLLPIARTFVDQHYEVGWLLVQFAAPVADRLRRYQIEPVEVQFPPPAPGAHTDSAFRTDRARATLSHDVALHAEFITHQLTEGLLAQIEPVRSAMRGYRPDVVVQDGPLNVGTIAAHAEGIPYVDCSVNFLLLDPPEPHTLQVLARACDARRREIFAMYGLTPDFRVMECASPTLNTLFATPELLGTSLHLPPATFLIGPPVYRGTTRLPEGEGPVDFPWERLDPNRPIALAALGTLFRWQPELFRAIAHALTRVDVPVQTVLAVGDLVDDQEFRDSLPSDAIVVHTLPQFELLERCAVFISHGGAGSVNDAFYHGVPLLTIPLGNDAVVSAGVVERAGVGAHLAREDAVPDRMQPLLQDLLHPSASMRKRLQQVSTSYRASDGPGRAVELIKRLVF